MKKTLLLFGLLVISTVFMKAQIVSIPDANFKTYLVNNFDTNGDGEIQLSEATSVLTINCGNKNIADLTGIEAFVNLRILACYANQLTNLDVSKNTALRNLQCYNNQLTSLDVSKNTLLVNLNCGTNYLTNLDVSKNTALTILECYWSYLANLDISKNTSLTTLNCQGNQLTSLNLKNGNNVAIIAMSAFSNPNLTCIQVDNIANANTYTTNGNWEKDSGASYNTDCNIVYIPDANFKAYLLGHAGINTNGDSEIQVSEAAAFNGTIDCNNRNISNLTGIEAFVNITTLRCNNNLLTSIDVSKNISLIDLVCGYNQITSIDVSKNINLDFFNCTDNQLTSLDVSKNTVLDILYCFNNQLTALDVSKNTVLRTLSCYGNLLKSMDVSQNPNLVQFSCRDNQLTNLNLKNGNNIIMTTMYAYNNPSLTCIQVDNVANSNSYTDWKKDTTASYNTNCLLSVSDISKKEIVLYPNPVKGLLNFSEEFSNIRITDFAGKIVKEISVSGKSVNLANLAKGIYIISATTKMGKIINKKIIKD